MDEIKEYNSLIKEYNFNKRLAEFHQKQACDEIFIQDRDFHLLKMKHFDALCEEMYKQIVAIYKNHTK